MGTLYTRPYGFQIRVTNKLLPKDLWATFDTRDAAEQYMHQLEGLLAQGIVPQALLERASPKQEIWTVRRCVLEYLKHNPVPLSERKLLDTVLPGVAAIATSVLNYEWAKAWIVEMKRVQQLAPSTIRHRHGALARCFDWMLRKHPEIMVQNPLRLLKRGVATEWVRVRGAELDLWPAMASKTSAPTRSEAKAKVTDFDHIGLPALRIASLAYSGLHERTAAAGLEPGPMLLVDYFHAQ
jgi:hypothetical protein